MADEDDEDQPALTIVCAGPPYCSFTIAKARELVAKEGCIWCSKIYTDPEGRVFIVQPGTA